MPVPEGWEWLNDLPEEWQTPHDLRTPTGDPETNLSIKILSCGILGQEVRAAVGRFITEYALFTMWFVDDVKNSDRETKEVAQISLVPTGQVKDVYASWKKFDSVEQTEASNEDLRELRIVAAAELADALERAAETLSRVREGRVDAD